jgi:hypothetical protein
MPAESEKANVAVMGCGHTMHLCCFIQHVRNVAHNADVRCPLCRAVQPSETEVPEVPASPEKRQRVNGPE